MSSQPFIENSVGVSVQQDKDGVVGRKVSLAPCAIQEQVCKVVEASHHGIIVPLGSTVACINKIKMHEEKKKLFEEKSCTSGDKENEFFFKKKEGKKEKNHLQLYF